MNGALHQSLFENYALMVSSHLEISQPIRTETLCTKTGKVVLTDLQTVIWHVNITL